MRYEFIQNLQTNGMGTIGLFKPTVPYERTKFFIEILLRF